MYDMMENRSRVAKGVFTASVRANRQIRERFYRLRLELSGAGAEAFARSKPGQFAQLDLSSTALPPAESIPADLADASRRNIMLRRPFSFCHVNTKGGSTFVDILYCVVGPASLRMTTLVAGDSISLIGPLGNGFSVPEGKKTALLVAGGMGAGPLQHLAQVLTRDYADLKVMAFAGAKTAKALPFESQLDSISQRLGFSLGEFAKYGVESLVTTDDGSAGRSGLVTDCFAEWLGEAKLSRRDTAIYSCGPEAMLERMAETAREHGIDCQVCMERRMACGIGVCQSCPVECKTSNAGDTVFKLCCKDGPVFDAKEVVFGR